MYKLTKPLIFINNTPSHVGAGGDLGVVDLPIQRERHTNFPKYESSSVKGSIKDAFINLAKKNKATRFGPMDNNMVEEVFGKDEKADRISLIAFTDARILLFPIKSLTNVFAWITCPKVLSRFKQEMKLCGIEVPYRTPSNTVPIGSDLVISKENKKIVLEEYTFEEIEENEDCTRWANWFAEHLFPSVSEFEYWRNKIKKDFVIVSDEVFTDFVTLSTDVITRVKIERDKGIVKEGALFTEEYLPAESILYSLVMTAPPLKQKDQDSKPSVFTDEEDVMSFFAEALPEVIQIGGNATIGKGITYTHLIE
ncbi:type III-B CRISPR module RAMP protein Cmr4 [Parageobacillus thermoglucosidasius]|uniref:type III-B CRISPR module RAMP protein Cmr4 n=1 Tax=Parageobacillus thermoglucosidasius TaxID=1426 RepID=UPI000B580821|nr:type III-B CRISPR module RAMP protein Cmr4 [Parageobacillus thermoglucosidasius]MBY6269759.1 type III-B CRISPR module RAMP protein Cmr4 [Parageobacillus thermoglucosidasius]MED4905584.1 type III-B CRISPR module RAMP protein Cmr4 [Parageobacillus thermoglucosidasius]MED4913970.1 type III-B CRISPR module RAMP protein Cmr4 [Parageobacillus thermoglucosidasius]MED4945795.1 type III-B CRISPR module RAMP protein Cmr4 [Parageobacillus thermoglucosidasius]MED4981276.1 type III-B CRISPR module RAMP 